jgi:hypothetical protein
MLYDLRRKLLDYNNPDSFVNELRRNRANYFKHLLAKLETERVISILDIGGTYRYWQTVGLLDPEHYHITILNLTTPDIPETDRGFSGITGDCLAMEFKDQQFDVVFSNSVIEHVGSRENQLRMADEIRRVGKSYYVQTPSYWFPLEPHSHIPFFQYLPRPARALLIWKFNISYFPRMPTYRECLVQSDSTIMLTYRQFRRIFPEATIIKERLFGMTKSYSAFYGFSRKKNLGSESSVVISIDYGT